MTLRRLPVLLLLVVAVGLLALAFRPRGAALPPNVLFIISDDLNNDLGAYGHPYVQSPHIDRLAQRGVRFDHAYTQYPVCNPSRSSFMTGLYPEQTGVLSNRDTFRVHVPDVVTLSQWFMQHGYHAARVGKIYHYGVPSEIGTAGMDDARSWHEVVNPRGIDREVHDRIHTLEPGQFGGTLSWLNLESRDEEHTDALGAAAAVRLLEERHPDRTGKPLFLAVGFYRPHTPYVAPGRYFDLYPLDRIEPVMEQPGDRDDIPVAALYDRPHQRELTRAQRQEIIQAYYASTSFMDAQVGHVLEALDRLGLADNTIVVFTSDHGYHLGAHGLWQKSDLFEGSVRVPLIIADPRGTSAGSATDAVAELVDLYPTLTEMAGLPAPGHLMGQSLAPVVAAPTTSVREAAYTVSWSSASRMHPELKGTRILGRTIRTDRHRYTEWGEDGAYGKELYDYVADPDEYTNLAGRPEAAREEARLRRLLAERSDAAQRPSTVNTSAMPASNR